jgi:hypothetical protein
MFIHWGLYAIPAGRWKGVEYPFIGQWIMRWARIPRPEYEALAARFDPTKFDAGKIAQLAQDFPTPPERRNPSERCDVQCAGDGGGAGGGNMPGAATTG